MLDGLDLGNAFGPLRPTSGGEGPERGRIGAEALAEHGCGRQGGLIAESELQEWIDWLVRDGELAHRQVQRSELYTNEFNPFWKGGP